MKLAIVGSRTFNDYDKLVNILFEFNFNETCDAVISGGARGADLLGKLWAEAHILDYTEFKPDWDKYDKSAGFIRNQQIVDAADIIIAFWDGKSKGTADTIHKAKLAKKPTFIVYF